jgi:hypothetical protein
MLFKLNENSTVTETDAPGGSHSGALLARI